MTLAEYKDANDLGIVDLAKRLGLSVGFASDLVNRKRSCSLKIAVQIERKTDGAVSCQDLLLKPKRMIRA